jgi:hypothetical protein
VLPPTPPPTPPSDPLNSLLLPFDGANGSTTFTDFSPTPATLTRHGNASISTAQSRYGGASLSLAATGDYLTDNNTSRYELYSGAFTVETWVYPTEIKQCTVVSYKEADWRIGINDDGTIHWVTPFANRIVSSSAIAANQWTHLAAVSDGTTTTLYVGGQPVGTTTVKPTSGAGQGSVLLYIGFNPAAPTTWNFIGFIDELRITKGVARYQSPFTPTGPHSTGA